MVGLSGLFVPVASFPPALRTLAHALPMTYAVNLLQGIWIGDPWSAHIWDVAALVGFFVVFTAISTKTFRWE
jgi:ABC-2 type transport system permease protein